MGYILFELKKKMNIPIKLANKIGIQEIYIGLRLLPKFGHEHFWYDWQHHTIFLGFIYVEWVGEPIIDSHIPV